MDEYPLVPSLVPAHQTRQVRSGPMQSVQRVRTTPWQRGVAVTSLGVSAKLLYVGPG